MAKIDIDAGCDELRDTLIVALSKLRQGDFSVRLDLDVVVKPHPHQELPVLHEIRRIFSDNSKVTVLSRESDTYEAVANCGIVVGFFSSVLLESALSGKPVVVSAFRDIHPSIDLSIFLIYPSIYLPTYLRRYE